MLNFSLRNRKAWWGVLGMCLGLMNAPAFSATFSTVFAFDLHTTAAGVVEGTGSNRGFLFGTTSDTQLTYGGAIYKVSVAGGVPQVIYQLKDVDGYAPQATLLVGTDGNLYGTTHFGPRSGYSTQNGTGTVFRVGQDGSGFKTLHQFGDIDGLHPVTSAATNRDGIYPDYALIQDAGYLYGVTQIGGLYGSGTVFRVRKSDGVLDVLHHFASVDAAGVNSSGEGANPAASLTLASDGRLYGVTSGGGTNLLTDPTGATAGTGTIYSLNPDGSDFRTVYNFSALDESVTLPVNGDGAQPNGVLLEVRPGVFISTTSVGGMPTDTTMAGAGTIFSFDTMTNTLITLYNFDSNIGAVPKGDLVLQGGRVYGTTYSGSTAATPVTFNGTLFGINIDGSNFSVEYALLASDGIFPTGGLILASNGDLYGTVSKGNACFQVNGEGYGAVFRYSLTTNASSSGYSNCTTYDSSSGGGGTFNPGFLWLLSALGLAPPVRRRVLGFR